MMIMIQSLLLNVNSSTEILLSVLPLSCALFLIFSSKSLLALLMAGEQGEKVIFYSMVLTAPATSYLSQLVSPPWMLLTGAGLVEFGFLTAVLPQNGLMFAFFTGVGISIIFHASYLPAALYFKRQSLLMCSAMLAVFWAVIINAAYFLDFAFTETTGLTCVGFFTIFTCVVPAGLKMKNLYHAVRTLWSDKVSMFSDTRQHAPRLFGREKRWHIILLAMLLIWWAVGVDVTWMDLRTPNDVIRILSIHCSFLILSFCVRVLLASKCRRTNESSGKDTSFNNFLALGLSGMTGMSIVIYPAFSDPFPCHMVFVTTLVIQLMDIGDLLYDVHHSTAVISFPSSSSPKASSTVQTTSGRGILSHIAKRTLMLLVSSIMFVLLVKPLVYVTFQRMMSFELAIAQEVALLGCMSLPTLCLAFLPLKGCGTSIDAGNAEARSVHAERRTL